MTWQHKYSGKNEESKRRQLENLKIGRKRQIKRSKLTISSKSLQSANIIDFATDPNFLGLSFKDRPAQEVLLRTLYNLPLTWKQKKILKQISPGYRTNGDHLLEAVWVLGSRSGKSLLASIIALYEATRKKWQQYLSQGESAYIVVVATRQKQAEQIIGANCARLIENSPGLSNLIEGIYSTELVLKNGMRIISLPCNSTAGRGLAVAAFILDEIGHYAVEGIRSDELIYNSLRPRMAQFPSAKVVLISTPSAKQGLLWSFYKEGTTVPQRFTCQADTRTINPIIPQEFIDRERKRDPDMAAREFDAEFAERSQAFFTDEMIENSFSLLGDFSYHTGYSYHVGIDQSGLSGRDKFAISICHKEADMIRANTVESFDTKDLDKVMSGVKRLKDLYHFSIVYIDKYASGWVGGCLKKLGLGVEIRPALPQIYQNLRTLMLAKRIDICPNESLKRALENTQGYYSKGNNLSIGHQRGIEGHADLADALATAVFIASQKGASGERIKVVLGAKRGHQSLTNYKSPQLFGELNWKDEIHKQEGYKKVLEGKDRKVGSLAIPDPEA